MFAVRVADCAHVYQGDDEKTGEILRDVAPGGRERPWREKHLGSRKVAAAYSALGRPRTAARCRDCGTVLVFDECPSDGWKRLTRANFCRLRLCPMCAWRRSLKLAATVSLVLHAAAEDHPEWGYVLLTVTQRNVAGANLRVEISRVLRGWDGLRRRKEFRPIAGWLRTLEVTRNPRDGTWHPHIHALLAVRPDYWHKQYVPHARWVGLWRGVLGLEYDPSVEVHRVRPRPRRNGNPLEAAAAEVAKYAVKDSDLVGGRDVIARVGTLDSSLRGRRLIGWGGDLRQYARRVGAELPDSEQDLVHLAAEDHLDACPICGRDLLPHVYRWVGAVRQYVG